MLLALAVGTVRARVTVDARGRWGGRGGRMLLTVRGKHIEVGVVPALGGRIVHLARPGGKNQLKADATLARIPLVEGTLGRLDYGGVADRVLLEHDKTTEEMPLWRAAFKPLILKDKAGKSVMIVLQHEQGKVRITRRIEVADGVPRVRVQTTYQSLEPRKVRVKTIWLDAAIAPGGKLGSEDFLLAGGKAGLGLLRCTSAAMPRWPMPASHGWWGAVDMAKRSFVLVTSYAGDAGMPSATVRHGAARASVEYQITKRMRRRSKRSGLAVRFDLWLLRGRKELAALTAGKAGDGMLAAAYRKPARRLLELLIDKRSDVVEFGTDRCTLADWGLSRFRVPGSVWGLKAAQSIELEWLPFGERPVSARLELTVLPWGSKRGLDVRFSPVRFAAGKRGPLRIAGELPSMRRPREPIAAHARWSLHLGAGRGRTVPLAEHPVLLTRSPSGSLSALKRRDRSPHRSVWATIAWRLRRLMQPRNPVEITSRQVAGLRREVELLARMLGDPRELSNRTGTVVRALGDASGNRIRPFMLHVPPDYRSTDSMPLVVVLPDSSPPPWRDVWKSAAAECHCIVLIPTPPNGSHDILARDVAEMIEVAKADYSIDGKKIALTGWGAGARLAWLLASRHPDRWLAFCPVGTITDATLGPLGKPPAAVGPPWRATLRCRSEIAGFAGNLSNLRIRIYHGFGDPAALVGHSARLSSRLRRFGIDHEFDVAKPLGYGVTPELAVDILTFACGLPRLAHPRRVYIKAMHVDEASSHWLQIGRFNLWDRPGAVRGRITERRVDLYVENVTQLILRLDDALFDKKGHTTVSVNGTKVVRWFSLPRGPQILEADALGKWKFQPSFRKPVGDRKRKGPTLAGPVRDALIHGFLAVYGTMVPAEADANRAEAEALVRTWQARGVRCELIADRAHRRNTEQGHLVLIGTPESNKVLSQLLPRLNVAVDEKGIRIGRRQYFGDGLGVVICLPHPRTNGGYVVLMTAPKVDGIAGLASRSVDFDFFVSDAQTTTDPATGVSFGWLSSNWDMDTRSTYGRGEKPPQ